MASWDFTIDSDNQKDLAEKLSTAADNFDTKVTALYGQIDSMKGTSWIGEDYDTFNTGVHNYEGALQDLSDSFRMFSEHYKLMADGTDTLATELIRIINNMTGNASDATSGEGSPVTPSDSYYDGEYTPGGGSNPGSGAGRTDVTGDEGGENGGSSPENTDPDPVPGPSPEDGDTNTHQSESGATHGGGGRRLASNEDDSLVDTQSSPTPDNQSTSADSSQNVALEERKVVDDDAFLSSTTYAQFSSNGGIAAPVYLDEEQTIYYQDGKIFYPDGHYDEKYLGNMYDFEDEWKRVNNYMFKSEVPVVVPSGYKLVGDTDFLSSTTYAQFSMNGGVSSRVYLDEAQTIYYENGKIIYPDHFEEVNLKNMYDFEDEWKKVNKYVYKDDCR